MKDPTARRDKLKQVRQLLLKKPDQLPQALGEDFKVVMKELNEIRVGCLGELARV